MGQENQIPRPDNLPFFRLPHKRPDPVVGFAEHGPYGAETVLYSRVQAGMAVQGDVPVPAGNDLDDHILRLTDKTPDGSQLFLIHKELGRLDIVRIHFKDLRGGEGSDRRTGFTVKPADVRRVETEGFNQFGKNRRVRSADHGLRRAGDFDFVRFAADQVGTMLLQHGL